MSELKILIHIGHHLNVVNLLGACTKAGGEKSSVNKKQRRNTFQIQRCLDVSVVESKSHVHAINASTTISTSLLIGQLLLLQNTATSHQWFLKVFSQPAVSLLYFLFSLSFVSLFTKGIMD